MRKWIERWLVAHCQNEFVDTLLFMYSDLFGRLSDEALMELAKKSNDESGHNAWDHLRRYIDKVSTEKELNSALPKGFVMYLITFLGQGNNRFYTDATMRLLESLREHNYQYTQEEKDALERLALANNAYALDLVLFDSDSFPDYATKKDKMIVDYVANGFCPSDMMRRYIAIADGAALKEIARLAFEEKNENAYRFICDNVHPLCTRVEVQKAVTKAVYEDNEDAINLALDMVEEVHIGTYLQKALIIKGAKGHNEVFKTFLYERVKLDDESEVCLAELVKYNPAVFEFMQEYIQEQRLCEYALIMLSEEMVAYKQAFWVLWWHKEKHGISRSSKLFKKLLELDLKGIKEAEKFLL